MSHERRSGVMAIAVVIALVAAGVSIVECSITENGIVNADKDTIVNPDYFPTSRFGDGCTYNRTAGEPNPNADDECPDQLNEFCDPTVQTCVCQQYYMYDRDLAQCRYEWLNAFIAKMLFFAFMTLCLLLVLALLVRWLSNLRRHRGHRHVRLDADVGMVEEVGMSDPLAEAHRLRYEYYMRERERELKANVVDNRAYSD